MEKYFLEQKLGDKYSYSLRLDKVFSCITTLLKSTKYIIRHANLAYMRVSHDIPMAANASKHSSSFQILYSRLWKTHYNKSKKKIPQSSSSQEPHLQPPCPKLTLALMAYLADEAFISI